MEFIHQVEPVIDENEIDSMHQYLHSGAWLTEFKKTEEFEELIARAVGAKYASVVNNGTISLTIAMLALGLKAGDDVLLPNLTMIATPFACTLVGINPVLTDISNEDLCMDYQKLEKYVTKNTKAVMFVNFNGRAKHIQEFADFCRENNIFLIEDAAQAFGSKVDNKYLGTFGSIGSFSFSPHKIITTGQGGALVTDDRELYEKIEKIKDFGRLSGGADIHDHFGLNSKFTDLQAVIGIEQIKKLEPRIKRKKEIFQIYYDELKHIDILEMIPTNLEETSPWFIDIFVPDPDGLKEFLKQHNIGSRRLYPPINKQKVYQEFDNLKFPVTDYYSSRGLWLPSSTKLSNDEIKFICSVLEKYYKKEGRI